MGVGTGVDEIQGVEVPEGYAPIHSSAPFGKHNGPIFERLEGERVWRGFRVLERHCNQGGIVHGGMLMTFADVVLGTAVWRRGGRPTVTVRMVVDFVAPARLGDWVEGTADLSRETKSLIFAECELRVAGRQVLTSSGIFKTIAPRSR